MLNSMKNKSYSEITVQACLVAFMLIVGLQCAFGQVTRYQTRLTETPPPLHDEGKFRWNNAGYFKSAAYTAKPNRLLDFSELPETWDGLQITTWVAFALSGIAHGAREAYHAEPTVFENRFGASDRSFWGSEAWVRNYEGNDPANPHKHEFFGNVGRDFWHTANMADFVPAVSCSFVIGARKQPIKYRVINLLIGIGARTLFSTVTYASMRQ